ncbi:conserved Plasmodium protein, unknown function [Plasmodium knowlesi strain H]|uniref:Uncharacterized protein n=3 Tax=Plasmodium knowlesi TaxID=5850 RepID=A0A1A7VZ20_PLAKH|nr:conserved Plasmodium protein, unknown function [Plasmodium knowlesi strain H]OTN66025.1 Uncharacterized protein PKNOH_S100031800 [Plasmodium knowlesi]CAA9987683.1 conserved Plasmodium protein, unknown function [Plasmodium knowlesi strain H]SBO26901.1 conserved Plasmodium protein, unknown function [Plasmodium knowlesi strain H]SBO29639.1 conserved Plasmodium protein, unknown function [Plasmodium knowlesi strain H]VVS77157.1 conserved Plasmodium protein, unknown function [Plasmodium knowlesi 
MEHGDILPKRFQKGVKSLVRILLKNFVFNLYYSLDKIKENDGIRRDDSRNSKMNSRRKLDKSKKNIEKCIDLCLVVLKTLEGDQCFFSQYVLENYSSIKLSHNDKRREGEKKKNNNKFDDALLIYHSYRNSQPSIWKNEGKGENNGICLNVDDTGKHSVFIGDKEVSSYVKKIVTIDSYINKHKMYSKREFIDELNNFLNEFYLKKGPSNDNRARFDVAQEGEEKEEVKGEEKNIIDDDCVTNNLFSEYFNSCRRNNKLVNTLIKEVNLQSLRSFHRVLYKNINFIRMFNARNDTKHEMDALQLSTLFEL